MLEFQGKFLDLNKIENAGRALMSLKQIRSAREFMQEFDRLAEMASQTGEAFLINQYRRNLKPLVQEKILRQNFNNLQDLQIASIEWDDTLFQFKRQQHSMEQKKPPTIPRTQGKLMNGTPMDLDFVRLSQEESEWQKRAGLCFRCGKGGHIGRNCLDKNKNQGTSKPQGGGNKIAAIKQFLPHEEEETVVRESLEKDFRDD